MSYLATGQHVEKPETGEAPEKAAKKGEEQPMLVENHLADDERGVETDHGQDKQGPLKIAEPTQGGDESVPAEDQLGRLFVEK